MAQLILASASPRRTELLQQIGVQAEIFPVNIDETPHRDENAYAYVERLAIEKAQAAWGRIGETQTYQQLGGAIDSLVVLAADTCVCVDKTLLGKPRDFEDMQRTLSLLSGRNHQVLSSFALINNDRHIVEVVTTEVTFRELTAQQINDYWQTGEPQDKAGSYGIQGLGAVFVNRISGSYSNVVGLPLTEVALRLIEFDVPIWETK